MAQLVNVPLRGAAQILDEMGLNVQGCYKQKCLWEKITEAEEAVGAGGAECGQTPREGQRGARYGEHLALHAVSGR